MLNNRVENSGDDWCSEVDPISISLSVQVQELDLDLLKWSFK